MKVNESSITMVKVDLERHVEEYRSQMTRYQFYQDKNESVMKNILQKTENLKVFMDSQVEQMKFDLSTKLRTNDMEQNFKQLNDILAIKFS